MRDRVYSILGALLVIGSVLAVNPWLEMGTNDDWAYIRVAQQLASTGHFVFNGWIAAIIGAQAVWAALLIRLFGFSFTLVRLSTLPFAAGCSILLYRLGRQAGLNPSFALFGALSVTLSPVFIPLSASFMTDVPGCFFWLACGYCLVRAMEGEAKMSGQAKWWMAAAALLGVVGGTVRQVVWFVPLASLPAVAWLRRKERPIVIWALFLWGATGLGMEVCLRWFTAQPYAVAAGEPDTDTWFEMAQYTVESLVQIAVGCLLLMIPVLAMFLAGWRRLLRTPLALAAGLVFSCIVVGGLWWFDDRLLLGNIITPTGILGSLDLPGVKPEILPESIRMLLVCVVILTTSVTAAMLSRPPGDTGGLLRFAWAFGPPCLVYSAAVVYRSVTDWLLFDRYLILLLPILVLPLLWHFQRSIRETPPAWSWALLGMAAWFGMALTHDYLAAGRARVQAATTMIAAGIPRTRFSAGYEYDGWTQLEQAGHIPFTNELATGPHHRYPLSPPFWFWPKVPAVDPVYVVTYSPLPGLRDSQFAPVPYGAWLPPFRRQVLTQRALE